MILDSIAHPWQAAAALEFTIPLSGRKGVEKDLAYAEHKVAWREVLNLEWAVILELRRRWRGYAATLERIKLLRDHIASVESTGRLAEELAAAKEIQRTDARVFTIEQALRRIELAEEEGMAEEQRIELKGLLGLTPSAPLLFRPELAVVEPLPEQLRERRATENSPALAVARAEYEVAEQNLRLEIRKQYPDLRIGPGYDVDQGQSTITLGFGIPIPIINLNRQGIAQARGHRLALKAAYERESEALSVNLALAQARLARTRATRRSIEDQLAPLVDLQLKETNDRAKLGEFDALLTLDAMRTHIEAKERVVAARLEEALAIDEINGLLGPTFVPADEEKK